MKSIKIAFLLGMLINTSSVYGESKLPHFLQYKIEEADIFKGKPAPVNLSSYKGAKAYKTKLREGMKAGPNFAGHYTIVSYGCGTQCQDNWIIDAKTGKIMDRFDSVIGLKYELDSALLIVNPPDADFKRAYEEHPEQPLLGTMVTTYKIIKDNKIKTIHQEKWTEVIKSLQ